MLSENQYTSNLEWIGGQESSCHSITIRQPKSEIGNWSCTFRPRLCRKVIHQRQPLSLESKIKVTA